jgi:CBS domain-containing protein
MKVSELLLSKGSNVYSIVSTLNVYEAIKVMGEKNIGALLVIEDDVLKGILSERDYARKVVLKDKTSRGTLVKEIMTADVISVSPSQTIDDCMQLMSTKRIRHLPVCENNKVVGIISISDIVTAIISNQKEVIAQLQNYISS